MPLGLGTWCKGDGGGKLHCFIITDVKRVQVEAVTGYTP